MTVVFISSLGTDLRIGNAVVAMLAVIEGSGHLPCIGQPRGGRTSTRRVSEGNLTPWPTIFTKMA